MSVPQAAPVFDREKFKDVVHYVCSRCEPEELGRVKLHKVLYFADMLHFLDTARPLTGVPYQKQEFGPTAKYLAWALAELGKEGRVEVSERSYYGYTKTDFRSVDAPSSHKLSNAEIQLLNDVMDFVCTRTAKEISELSHNAAWQMFKMGEEIPYYSAFFIIPTETTDEDVVWGEAAVRELGLAS